ncbi:cytochrome P450 [Nocardioides sp.]|uniref:cytochrome P450 n=1 Tax=Nocardioides sp. TaxID=35761 RepID=UPI0035641647
MLVDLFDPAAVEDPYPLYARLRESAPVHQIPGTGFFLVSTWDLVQEAVSRTEDFSSNMRSIMMATPSDPHPIAFPLDAGGTVEQVLATADEPDHKLHRSLVMSTMNKRIRALDEYAHQVADRLWDDYAKDGRIDWVADMAERLPLAMLSSLIGLPEDEFPYLLSLAYDASEMLGGIVEPERVERLVKAVSDLIEYLDKAFQRAQEDPQDDLMGVFANAVRAGEIESSTVTMILLQMVSAGAESTAALVETAARFLAEDPVLQDRVRQDPALIDPFLDECLRLESPFRGHYRSVPRHTELGGVTIPAGSHMFLLWGSANRDSNRFEEPDVLNLDRPGIRQHLAFGKGAHFCVGSALARMEGLAAIGVLLRSTARFELDPERPPTWVPSTTMRRHRTLDLVFAEAGPSIAVSAPEA